MRTWTTALALGLTAAFAPAAVAEEGGRWIEEFDKAVEIAKQENKDLLVDFTGSDWCGWCIKLHDEVFQHEAFYGPVEQDYVLVYLDFPKGEEVLAEVPNIERNRELASIYGVQGYPTVLLMTPEGRVFGRTGYQKGGPEAYVEHLEQLETEGKAALEANRKLIDAYEAAEGDAKAKAFDAILAAFEDAAADAAGVDMLADVLEAKLGTNPEGEIAERIVGALLDKGHTDEPVTAAARRLDPKNEKGLLEQVVAAKFAGVASQDAIPDAIAEFEALIAAGSIQDEEIALSLYTSAAWWCHKFTEQPEKAKAFATKAKALCPEDDQKLMEVLDMILKG